MTEKSDLKSLKNIRAELNELDIEELRSKYVVMFGEEATDSEGPTNDRTTLLKKLTYATYIQAFSEAGLNVPKKVTEASEAIFAEPFKSRKTAPKAGPRYTIQMFLVDTLHDAVLNGAQYTIEQLSSMVVEKFPESTYKNDPIGRMKIDIRKYNQGGFEYAKKVGKVPADASQHFMPAHSAATERKTRAPREESAAITS
ncbi:MAG: hypothetical protein H7831_10200 [Magnetococcus sp. WYHC-3]